MTSGENLSKPVVGLLTGNISRKEITIKSFNDKLLFKTELAR